MHKDLLIAIENKDYKTVNQFLNTNHFSSDSSWTTQRVDDAFISGWKESEKIFETKTDKQQQAIEVLSEALKEVDKYWYDATGEEAGACMGCDANLDPRCIGMHKQINGDWCPFQAAHEALAKAREILSGE